MISCHDDAVCEKFFKHSEALSEASLWHKNVMFRNQFGWFLVLSLQPQVKTLDKIDQNMDKDLAVYITFFILLIGIALAFIICMIFIRISIALMQNYCLSRHSQSFEHIQRCDRSWNINIHQIVQNHNLESR